jgi:hypothetical protein
MTESRVDIFDGATGQPIATCHGPTTAGNCPWTRPDGTVRCAGHRIAPLGFGPESWQQWVPGTARRCPLSSPDDPGGAKDD